VTATTAAAGAAATGAAPNASPFRRRPSLQRLNAGAGGTLTATLGIEITELGDDYLRGRMPVDERTRQPFGLLHGGASVALAETLGSLAANLCLDAGRAVGLEINANHLRAVTEGWVTGTARPLHLGRSTQVWEIRIEDGAGRPSCVSRLTMAVVPDR
jgi:1,4-dihydroxy-2-naphthoyl-CoA hydrolase